MTIWRWSGRILLFYIAFQLDDTAMITICTGVMGIVGLMMVHRTCQPYNTIRKVMIVVLGVLFVIAYFGFPTLFNLQELNLQSALILIVFGLLSWPVMKAFCRFERPHARARFEAWARPRPQRPPEISAHAKTHTPCIFGGRFSAFFQKKEGNAQQCRIRVLQPGMAQNELTHFLIFLWKRRDPCALSERKT